jgi:hypothetical protein
MNNIINNFYKFLFVKNEEFAVDFKPLIKQTDYIKPYPKKTENKDIISRINFVDNFDKENILEGLEGLNVSERELFN